MINEKHLRVAELRRDIRKGNYDILRDASDLSRIIDNININLQLLEELRSFDYDYIQIALDKAKTLLANAAYILDSYAEELKNEQEKQLEENTLDIRIAKLNEKLKHIRLG